MLDQPFKMKNSIVYLNQDNFLPKNITVKEVIEYFNIYNRSFLDDEILQKIRNTRIRNISGGETRYLEVKLILNLDSDFVLLDEPFNGISPIHIELIKEIIVEKSGTKGIILTDHDYRNVLDVANRNYLLFDGGLKKIGSKGDLAYWGYLPE